ncbi:MAG: YhbY family RNA-binding protein [Gammaproteobacteria bacterium]|nr:YhbY family RNA-binding protein [Gammaproteobacteria bacterium]MBI5783612.1 YhbY family RNA-binding protein [Gammaproteobacteria bacterium]
MPLTPKQRKQLKALAHHRKPVVQVGNAGITPAVIREIDQALDFHELIKIRLPGVGRGQRSMQLGKICDATGADAVQEIGRIGAIYRRAEKPRLKFPE